MPYISTTLNAPYSSLRREYICQPWSYSTPANFSYLTYEEQYNAVQRRPKPDPLTDTALPLQWKKRNRHCYGGYLANQQVIYANLIDTVCNPDQPYKRTRTWKTFYTTIDPAHFASDPTNWQSKLLEKAKQRHHNLGSSLAEFRETGKAFYAFGSAVHDAYRAMRRGDLGHILKNRTLCSVNSAELAYSFGIAPLAADLYGAAEALKLKVNEDSNYFHFFDTSTVWKKGSLPNISTVDGTYRASTSFRTDVMVKMRPVNRAVTFGNPSLWAWELIPFSFVVDWGIPIGTWLEDLDILQELLWVKGTQTIKKKYVHTYKSAIADVYGVVHKTPNIGKTTYNSHERKLLTTITLPLPRWKPSSTWRKVHRAVSLLIAVNSPCKKYPAIAHRYR
jgi:hypothetical protein